MPVFRYVKEFLGDLASPEYHLNVTENKHYWVKKDDYEAVEDLARSYLEGEVHSFEFEPLNDSSNYQAVVDEAQNMVITQLRELDEVSGVDGYGSLEMNGATKEYLKCQIVGQMEIIEDSGSYQLILEPERQDELDLMNSPAFS